MFGKYVSEESMRKALLNNTWRSLLVVSIPFELHEDVSSILVSKGVEPGTNVREPVMLPIIAGNSVREYFVIPSSSIRGVFRKITYGISRNKSVLENLFTGLEFYKDGLAEVFIKYTCDHSEDDADNHVSKNMPALADIGKEIKNISSIMSSSMRSIVESFLREVTDIDSLNTLISGDLEYSDIKRGLQLVRSMFCLVCGLYGSSVYRSSIQFKPVVLTSAERFVRTRVAIDRKSLTAKENMLFSDYTIVPGGRNYIEFIIRDLEPGSPVSRLLALTLEYIMYHGIPVGAGKSIGYGLLRIVGDDVKWIYFEYSSLKDYIEYIGNRGKYVREKLDNLIKFLKYR